MKLKRKQTIDQGVYNSIDSDDSHENSLQFAELWTSRKNKEGDLYLINPFGSVGKQF